MLGTSAISCDLDLETDGKRLGNLNLVHSDNEHAFGAIPIPIAVIKNGSGPTVLLSAGNHGDEYEGQVILRRLIHELDAASVHGRLIVLPALNYPAMLANARVSPLDRGNLNRSFPGRDDGSPTAAIAHFVSTQLLPLADAGIDLHSGGSQTYYLPCTFLCTCADESIMQQSLAMSDAFNAPFTYVVRGDLSMTGFDPVAQAQGVPFISTELAGGGNVDPAATRIGMDGVRNVLEHLGVLGGSQPRSATTRYLDGIAGMHRVTAPFTGVFAPQRSLGEEVVAGDVAGELHALEELDRPPMLLPFERDGIVVVRRNGARVRRGDHLYLAAREVDRNGLNQLIESVRRA